MPTAKNAPTPAPMRAKISKAIDEMQGLLCRLHDRWQDEREYEDLAEYGKVIAKQLPKWMKLETMTKRPFGFVFSIGTAARYRCVVTTRQIGWDRLK